MRRANKARSRMSKKNVAAAKSQKSAKSATKKSAKSAPNVKQEFGRVARVLGAENLLQAPTCANKLDTGATGARTKLIENFLASRGAKGASIREIENATKARAVAMHVRTLYNGARGRKYLDRRVDSKTGALVYFVIAPRDVKAPSSTKSK